MDRLEASVEAEALMTVLDEYRPVPLPISFVYGSGQFLSIKLRTFLDFVAPHLKAPLTR